MLLYNSVLKGKIFYKSMSNYLNISDFYLTAIFIQISYTFQKKKRIA